MQSLIPAEVVSENVIPALELVEPIKVYLFLWLQILEVMGLSLQF